MGYVYLCNQFFYAPILFFSTMRFVFSGTMRSLMRFTKELRDKMLIYYCITWAFNTLLLFITYLFSVYFFVVFFFLLLILLYCALNSIIFPYQFLFTVCCLCYCCCDMKHHYSSHQLQLCAFRDELVPDIKTKINCSYVCVCVLHKCNMETKKDKIFLVD